MRLRLGVLTSHPIQYQAPLFRELARRCDLQVFFAHRQTAADQARADFGVEFDWDVDLLSGYSHTFLRNRADRPDVSRFGGCDCPEIAGIVARGGFDAFLVSGWYLKAHWQAIRACRRYRVPVMVRGDSTLRSRRPRHRRIAGRLVRSWIVRQFDAHCYVGVRNRELLESAGAHSSSLFFSPHCVDNEWFRSRASASEPGRLALRFELASGTEAKIALFVGKLTETKRPRDLLLAIAALRARGLAVAAAFVGNGPLEEDLRAVAGGLEVPAVFEGFRNQSELPARYAAADLLVLPSESETWGLVVNEAMACGTPAVVSEAVGCAPDLISPGATGDVYPSGNVEELALAMRRVLERGPSWKEALAQRIETYSVAAAASGIENGVQSVARGPR